MSGVAKGESCKISVENEVNAGRFARRIQPGAVGKFDQRAYVPHSFLTDAGSNWHFIDVRRKVIKSCDELTRAYSVRMHKHRSVNLSHLD